MDTLYTTLCGLGDIYISQSRYRNTHTMLCIMCVYIINIYICTHSLPTESLGPHWSSFFFFFFKLKRNKFSCLSRNKFIFSVIQQICNNFNQNGYKMIKTKFLFSFLQRIHYELLLLLTKFLVSFLVICKKWWKWFLSSA